ncbi:MAG: hypothetical protein QOF63_3651 [Thermoanaerobaculia bacterium]|jgi:hypothetical protein|nr:hypothetical protein [Thermoanaerobaculia bacterium]
MDAWTKVLLGTVSLFPFAGRIGRLRGFYPHDQRDWFVYISGAASLIIYAYLNFFFEDLTFYVSLIRSTIVATMCLILYAAIQVATDDEHASRAGWKQGVLTGSLLLLYVLSIASYTYTYNTLAGLRTYRICRAFLRKADTHQPLKGATLLFTFADNTKATETTDDDGYFFHPVKRSSFTGLRVRSGQLAAAESYCQSYTPDEFTDTVLPVVIEVGRCSAVPN